MPNCKNCKIEFTIYPGDQKMLDKFEVPQPQLCPDCRMQRRLAWRPNLAFYSRQCDLCRKPIITQYSPNVPFPVYCPVCWWGDNWDRQANAREYDSTQPFFSQYMEVMNSTPRLSTFCLNCVNCDYTDKTAGSKNCYLIIGSKDAEDCYYGEKYLQSRDCLDCNMIIDCELSYFCLDNRALFNCNFCQFCSQPTNLNFCYDCKNCSDCFACWNLRNKQFYIFNKPYNEKDYKERIKDFYLGSHAGLVDLWEKFQAEKKENAIHRFRYETHGEENSGDYLFRCQNCFHCFNLRSFKDSRYTNDDEEGADMMDTNNCGYGELCYEIQDAYGNHFCRFCNVLTENSFCDYCVQVASCKDCFGCAGLNKAQYCILNKQYSEKEYRELRNKIVEAMSAAGEWGEFFPIEYSPFTYNESKANILFPLSKEEVISRGWRWVELTDELKNRSASDYLIPNDIKDVQDDILEKILICTDCGKNYKLIKQELDFYRKKDLPVPRQCFRCRYFELFNWRNPRRLYHRQCMNTGCKNEFETTYSPDRPEKVYCGDCYQKEIY